MRKQKVILSCQLLLFLFMLTVSGFAQESTGKGENVKIGLVLSGGGASGLAHVGVIKVLEEAGIKPDIITGTSMGSIIGGLYSVGYTSEELSDLVKDTDWLQLLSDSKSMQKVSMSEKSETNKYLFEIPINDKHIKLPGGLIEGQHIESYLSKLFWPLTDKQDFNDLPVPFHCLAVDLISGKNVELQSGNLVKSIRASMSIPTLFSPVEMDSMLLVDGGIKVNFPVQQAIDMGADIIIGVYVGYNDDVTANEISSMADILQRSTALAGIVDAKLQFSNCDILIIPDLGKYGPANFSDGEIVKKLGEESARKQYDEIAALAKKYNRKFTPIQKMEQVEKILITKVEVENLQFLDEEFVRSKSGIKAGDSVSFGDISETIEYMFGTQYFLKLTYSLRKSNNVGEYILVFHVKEKPRAKIGIAPNYDSDRGVGVVTNITYRNIIFPSSRLSATVHIAEDPGISIVLDDKLGKSHRFSNHVFLNGNYYDLMYRVEKNFLGMFDWYHIDGGYGIDYAIGLNHLLALNAIYKYNFYNPKAGFMSHDTLAQPTNDHSNIMGVNLKYKSNTTDDLFFPTKGSKFETSFEAAYSVNPRIELAQNSTLGDLYFPDSKNLYATLLLDYNWYKTFANRFTYNFGVGTGLRRKNSGFSEIFMLGGNQFNTPLSFKNFVGFNFAEIYAQDYAYIKSGLNLKIFPGFYLSATANVGNLALTRDNFFNNFSNNSIGDYYWGYSFGLKYNSILGPIQFLISDNNKDSELRYYLGLGFPF